MPIWPHHNSAAAILVFLYESLEITSFYKGKGPHNDLNSDRGIFKLNLIRSIQEKIIYNDIYNEIDRNMSSAKRDRRNPGMGYGL